MVLKKITYLIEGKKQSLDVKICNTFFSKAIGLMFRRQSPPLLFIFNKTKTLSIHSFFCKPFKAIWLDDDMAATRIIDVNNWKFHLSGRGKYLLENPTPLRNNKSSTRNKEPAIERFK